MHHPLRDNPIESPVGKPSVTDQSLYAELLTAVDKLLRRRADQLDEKKVDQFVRKGWLQWNGGALKLTPMGAQVCDTALLAYA
jgi:hypothetical protein